MTIPALPALDRASATFKTDVDTFFASQLPAFSAALDPEIERLSALGYGSYNASSTTSLTIGTGSKSLTIETGKGYVAGQAVLIASTADPSSYMAGQVTSYNSGTGALVVNVTTAVGSGTVAAWTISVTALSAGGGGVSPDSIVVLASGTSWACPAGVTKARLRVVGGGGGGANSGSSGVRAGGGGGGGLVEVFVSLTPATSYTYAIGSGGVPGGALAGDSSMTVLGVTYSATGGGPGGAWIGGTGGGGSGTGALVLAGQKGFGSQAVSNNANVANALSAVGGAYGRGGQGGQTSDAEAGNAGAIILELYK